MAHNEIPLKQPDAIFIWPLNANKTNLHWGTMHWPYELSAIRMAKLDGSEYSLRGFLDPNTTYDVNTKTGKGYLYCISV